MKTLKDKGIDLFKQQSSFLLKVLILSSILIPALRPSIARAEGFYKLDTTFNIESRFLKLKRIDNSEIIYFPLYNFAVADMRILKSIDFKPSKDGHYDGDDLQEQALKFGAGWIRNVNKSDAGKIRSFFDAVKAQRGIWALGYMEQHASKGTYNVIRAYLNQNGISIGPTRDTGIKPAKKRRNQRTFNQNSNNASGCNLNMKDFALILTKYLDSISKVKEENEAGIFAKGFKTAVQNFFNWPLKSYENLFSTIGCLFVGLMAALRCIKVWKARKNRRKEQDISTQSTDRNYHSEPVQPKNPFRQPSSSPKVVFPNFDLEKKMRPTAIRKTVDGKYSYKFN